MPTPLSLYKYCRGLPLPLSRMFTQHVRIVSRVKRLSWLLPIQFKYSDYLHQWPCKTIFANLSPCILLCMNERPVVLVPLSVSFARTPISIFFSFNVEDLLINVLIYRLFEKLVATLQVSTWAPMLLCSLSPAILNVRRYIVHLFFCWKKHCFIYSLSFWNV